jgi:superfamily II DNA or RNA helicase
MKEIGTLLENKANILFIAPTGWGKTTLLLDLIQDSPKSWLYLAPLRALANEFYLRVSKIQGVYLIKTQKEGKKFFESGIKFKLLIITPELLLSKNLPLLPYDSIFVFDEIHLFSYWGDSFRPRLREAFEDILSYEFSTLSLTATMDKELLERWKQDSKLSCENNYIINLKNHSLKKDPQRRINVNSFSKDLVLKKLKYEKSEYAILVFCKYRQEVTKLKENLINDGFDVLSCIGGEAEQFSLDLLEMPKPDFILSTSTLSHGVNLPRISNIYISYKTENYDFWIQMTGRAGRKGEDFRLYTHDHQFLTRKELCLSFLSLLFMKFKNMIYWYELRRYINS